MKKLVLTAILVTFVFIAFGQSITLKIGTEATYHITKPGKKFTLTLVDTQAIDRQVNSAMDLFKGKVDSTLMKIAFVKSKFGDRPSILLVIKTGQPGTIRYSAKIKYPGRRKFVSTDVNPIIGNVNTTEMWQDDISEIMLSDFGEGSF